MAFLTEAANRGSVSTGYDIANSLLLDNSDNDKNFNHHQMSPGGDDQWSAQSNAGTNSKKATISMWIKRSKLSPSSGDGQHMRLFQFQTGGNATALYLSNDKINMYDDVTSAYLVSNRLLRDTSAWYHIVLAMDSTQSTAANRVKIYVNGVQETSWSTEDYGNQNADLAMFSTTNVTWLLGCASSQNSGYAFDGYMAEVHLVDGAQKEALDFGEFDEDSGIWVPIEYKGSHGTLGAYYNFEDTSNNRFNDESGNGNFMDNRGGVFEGGIATDTPTNNFCLLNGPQQVQSRFVFTQGLTTVNLTGDHGYRTIAGDMGFQHGKWYAEFKMGTGRVQTIVGMTQLDDTRSWQDTYIGGVSNSTAYGMGHSYDGYFYRNGGSGAIGVSWTAGDIIGIAIRINADGTGFMGMSKNGTWMNSQDPSSGTTGMLGLAYGNPLPAHLHHSFAITLRHDDGPVYANFGGFPGFTISSGNTDANGYGNFEYEVPTGYYALCSKNLGEFG